MSQLSLNPAFPGVGAGVGAALSLWQGIENRNAASRTLRNLAGAASVELQDTNDAFMLERRKLAQRGQLALGSLRASAAERGLTTAEGLGQAMVSVQLANDAVDQQISERNRRANLNRIRRQYDANVAQVQQQVCNLLVQTLQGGIQGGLSGAQIGQYFPT